MSGPRNRIVAGNWKMHLLQRDVSTLCRRLVEAELPAGVDVVLFPSFPLLPVAAQALRSSDLRLGGQDLHPESQGAHTGDVSGEQLVDAGCHWVLVGHSERRRDHGETFETVAQKLRAAVRSGLHPLVCLGETLEQRQSGETEGILMRQLEGLWETFRGLDPDAFALAYEPVWAIGTGATATPAEAQGAHRFLRSRVSQHLGESSAAALRILYGGSVKSNNARELVGGEDVDGFLVGGASLDAEQFLGIITSSARLGASAPRRRHP